MKARVAEMQNPGKDLVPENYLDCNVGLAQRDPLAFID
tara:strand:+ start:1813 stop:1926 length:114 start_codon:yes stop_codon:yes gene_type:complete